MSFKRCPGSVAFSQPTIEIVRCPNCGGDAEVWSDETEGACPKCGKTVMRTNRQSCVDWCKYARECLGDVKYTKYQDMKSGLRKEALLHAAQTRFGWDATRTQHARTVLKYAEEILKEQPDADPNIVIAAVILSIAGGSEINSAPPPETPGASAGAGERGAHAVLEELNYPHGFVKQVCDLVTPPPHGVTENINFRVMHDAELLADLAADPVHPATGARNDAELNNFLTPAGKRIAQRDRRQPAGI